MSYTVLCFDGGEGGGGGLLLLLFYFIMVRYLYCVRVVVILSLDRHVKLLQQQ